MLCRPKNTGTLSNSWGRSASHITLEAALQTQPNITLVGEEVSEKKQTLNEVIEYVAGIVAERATKGMNYGVALIPEGTH
jgi:pyrophosphate--fructose-6-phosphate 1-phosphotransferase